MKSKTIIIITVLILSIMFFAANSLADVPAPPVNQSLGMPDTIFMTLVEADCRVCHDSNDNSSPDRHHLIYGSAIIYGLCATSNQDVPCLSDAECTEPPGNFCVGETAASNPYSDNETYACLSCHDHDTTGGVTKFLIERDCFVCHVQNYAEASVHHLTGTAQGTNSPLGDPTKGDCTPCHGSLVDDYGDNATIPTYEPGLVTPAASNGTASPLNSRGNGAGACNYCHDYGTDTASNVTVYNNMDTHHSSGVDTFPNGDYNTFNGCLLCHGSDPWTDIRECEQCHGMESLHSIQADSDGCYDVIVGGELYGYGHVGIDDPGGESDCWGCHGFGFSPASAPGSGPTVPFISSASHQVIIAGTDTSIVTIGSSFTNFSGTTEFVSTFNLTSNDGTVVELTPKWTTACACLVTIPGTTAPGNYLLTALKDNGAAISNPLPISIKPPVIIESSTVSSNCGGCTGELTITGSGFGDPPPAGSESYINVKQNNVRLDITTWSDTLITATGAGCGGSPITVNSLYDSAATN